MKLRVLEIEQLEMVNGGDCDFTSDDIHKCHGAGSDGSHKWVFTGETRPGTIFRSLWPDYLHKCAYCGETEWMWRKM